MLTSVNSDVDGATIFRPEIPTMEGWRYSDVLFANSKKPNFENAGVKHNIVEKKEPNYCSLDEPIRAFSHRAGKDKDGNKKQN